jgi:hypothetical protein
MLVGHLLDVIEVWHVALSLCGWRPVITTGPG